MKRKAMLAAMLLTAIVVAVSATGSQEGASDTAASFPEKEIRVVVPYSPGGASDKTARKFASVADGNDRLPEPIVVTNIPGAGANNGLQAVATAQPDGYTVLLHHNVFITMELLGQMPESIEWDKGFEPIAQVLETPLTIAVLADSRWETLEDLFDEIEANPGEIKVAFPGVGSPQSFGFQALLREYEQETGRKLEIHPIYLEGGAAVKTAHLGGVVDVVPGITMDTVPEHKAGTYRILAVASESRLPALPEVPTIREAGYPMPVSAGGMSLRMSLWAPAGTPAEITGFLGDLAQEIVATGEWEEFAESLAAVVVYRNPEQLGDVFQTDSDVLEPVVPIIRAAQ